MATIIGIRLSESHTSGTTLQKYKYPAYTAVYLYVLISRIAFCSGPIAAPSQDVAMTVVEHWGAQTTGTPHTVSTRNNVSVCIADLWTIVHFRRPVFAVFRVKLEPNNELDGCVLCCGLLSQCVHCVCGAIFIHPGYQILWSLLTEKYIWKVRATMGSRLLNLTFFFFFFTHSSSAAEACGSAVSFPRGRGRAWWTFELF